MDAECFFARWSKRNAEAAAERSAPSTASAPQLPKPVPPPPSLDDVALLTPESDFTRFVARGVDENVRRSAMKKLFADPRFNVMDGLDVYIEDYHSFTPIPPAMLAALSHAKTLLNPLAHLEGASEKPQDAAPEEHVAEATGDIASAPAGETASENTAEHDDPPEEEQPSHGDPVQGL